MKYLFLEVGDDNNRNVTSIYYNGKDLTDEQKATAIVVESVPEPENRPGKSATLKYSETDGLYYDYVDCPLTQEEQMEALKAENQSLNTAIVELYEIVLGGI